MHMGMHHSKRHCEISMVFMSLAIVKVMGGADQQM